MVLLALTLSLPASGIAQSTADTSKARSWYETVSFNFFVSSGYSYNANRPDSMKNNFRVFDFDDNSIKLDVVELSVAREPAGPSAAGFRVDLTAGSSIPRVTRSAGMDIGDLDFHQMYLSYIAPLGTGLRLDAGKFITPLGYEVIEGYDRYNENYSRSLLFGYAIPFTHTGLRAGYAFTERLSAQCMVVNGWDNATDNNRSKSVSGAIAVVPAGGMSLCAAFISGPEKDRNDSDDRSVFDLAGTYDVSGLISLGVNADYGRDQHSSATGGDAVWKGVAGYLRFNLTGEFLVALRAEQFEDRDGFRTGISQRLREVTLTGEYRPASHFVVRGELRVDSSDRDVFQKQGAWTSSQMTLGVNAMFVL